MIVEIMRPKAEMPHDRADVYLGPYPSGAPAIMISAAARMGAPAGIIGGVGRDAFGSLLIDRLEGYGVDCRHVLRAERGSTGNAFVMYHEDGSREFIFHIDGTPAVEAPVPDVSQIENPGYFHVMGCSLTANEAFCRRIVETALAFRERGAELSFDPNIRPELLHGDLADALRDAVGEHHHARQRKVRVVRAHPALFCALLVRIRPVIDLIFDEFAAVQGAEGRAG